MMSIALLWGLAITLMVIGLAGVVLPMLPGVILIWSGILLGAWIDDFSRVSVTTVVVISILAVFAWGLDFIAGLMGAKKVAASKLALIGAALGTIAGLFTGLIGLLFMPLAGAAIGEYIANRNQLRAVKVGIATWMGMMIGLLFKVVLSFTMVGIFVASLFI